MSKKIGLDCKLYIGAAPLTGDPSTGVWTEMTNVRDVSIDLTKGEADVSTRGSTWRQLRATLKEGPLTIQMVYDTDDTAFNTLQSAWDDGGEVALAAMDGDITVNAAEGLASNFEVFDFGIPQPLEDAVVVDIVVKPSSFTTWYTTSIS